MRGRDKFSRYKKIIELIVGFYRLFPYGMRRRMFVAHRKTRGYYGIVTRYALLKTLAGHVGDNVSIMPDVYLFNVQELEIGDNVSIHPMTYIEAYGGVSIGSDVSIAHAVSIISVNHGYHESGIPIKDQPLEPGAIRIEDNVWVGAKASILAGTTIATGTVIGAGAIVTKDVPANTIAVGIPAKAVKER